MRLIFSSIFFLLLLSHSQAEEPAIIEQETATNDSSVLVETVESEEVAGVYVIPIQGPIGKPALYIVRRAVKEAIENDVDVILIDMNTPGGALDSTLEIMKILDRFEGRTITFVNAEAISAGSYIAIVTDSIYFVDDGLIGAAEAVSGTGQEIPEGMKRKLQSYLNAKIRNYTEDYRYRGDVMRAMTDPNFEFKIDEEVFSKEGDLLTLTAEEAITPYGDPPENLLGASIVEELTDVLDAEFGEEGYEIKEFEITWSENLAKWMQGIVPALLGIGMLLLFIEFKTPSFGILGGVGIALIVIVFASNYVAGLAGYEVILLFALGVIFLALEFFLFPGIVVLGFLGIVLILVSLVWSLADVWPTVDGDFSIDWGLVLQAFKTVILSTLFSLITIALIWRILPSRMLKGRLVLQETSPSPNPASVGGGIHAEKDTDLPAVGEIGEVLTELHPIGTVKISGKRYEATAETGSISKGSRIEVIGYKSFSLTVKEIIES